MRYDVGMPRNDLQQDGAARSRQSRDIDGFTDFAGLNLIAKDVRFQIADPPPNGPCRMNQSGQQVLAERYVKTVDVWQV
jgi:hypothetical protein